MSKREYTGSPIDLTWNSGPWANNGETISATTDDDTGSMTTEDWPEGATPKEELNDDEIAVIKTASKSRDITTLVGVSHAADIDRSESYANYVLKKHWPEGKQQIMERGCNDNTRAWANEKGSKPIEMVETFRKEALNGSTAVEIAEKHGVGATTVKELLRGNRNSLNSKIPRLRHTTNGAGGKWVIATEDSRLPLDHVEKVRSRILDGEKVYQIAGDYEVGPSEVYKAVVGMGKYESVNAPTPPLESDGSGLDSEWYVPESETEAESDVEQEQAEIQETEPEPEPMTTETTHTGYTPRETHSETNNTTRNALLGVVAFIVGYLLGNRGDDE